MLAALLLLWAAVASAYISSPPLKAVGVTKSRSLTTSPLTAPPRMMMTPLALAVPLEFGTFRLFQQALLVNGVGAAFLAVSKQKSLTRDGLIHATALGIGLWSYLGWQGWLVCVSYLVLGSVVTKVRMQEKEKLGIAEKRGGMRGPENVWGSAATAMVCAMLTRYCTLSAAAPALATIFAQAPAPIPSIVASMDWVATFRVGYVAALATKLSDTWGSELGKAFGKTCYLITSMKLVPRGTEGAVSVEGTVAGVVASVLLTAAAMALKVIPATPIVASICVISAFLATTIESVIGAVWQDEVKRPWLTNELVNLIMTVIGAEIAMFIYVSAKYFL